MEMIMTHATTTQKGNMVMYINFLTYAAFNVAWCIGAYFLFTALFLGAL